MINIKIICVGNYKEKYLKEMNNEYIKRLSKYCKIETIVLKDESIPSNLNSAIAEQVKAKEASLIISKLQSITNPYIFVMDETGTQYDSVSFAKKLENIPISGHSTIVFVIGGSLGLTDSVRALAHDVISFSKLTFPHQLIRVFLLEQLFRSFKINNNESYHH